MAPVVAVVAAAVAKITVAAVVKFVVTTALSIGVSRLLAKRAMSKAQAGGDGGGRVQLPPATDNKIPVVYGTAFLGGVITDAMISADQKTMWYVVAIAENTDTSAGSQISYGDVYYDGKLVQFGTNGAVTALINNSTTPSQSDGRVNGYLDIYLYRNGSSTPVNSSFTAQQVLSVANGVPASQAWTASNQMTNCAFAIVKVKYNTDAGTTGLGALTAQVINTESGQSTGVFRPGSAIKDYMLNTRYGCAIPLAQIDTTSLDNLNTYSSQTISVTGGPSPTQARYRINGPLDTARNCLDNLQFLVDRCDSWLQYSELTGKWKVVINKAYTQAPNAQTTNNLFIVNSSNLVGGIEISPIDLNETYNQVEVAYPNTNIKDQTDYQIINLFDINPSLLSQNEAVNRLNITLPLVNNAVQAKYLAARRIYQSREDLVISFRTDYSGIQVEAGDIVRVYHETYGWDAAGGFPDGKLFRISEVLEEKDTNGNLYASFRAFEYNASIYVDDPVEDYIPAFNTGLTDPNIISAPGTPVIVNFDATDATVTAFQVQSYIPDQGLVKYIDFNYGYSANVLTHRTYMTRSDADGTPFQNSDTANSVFNYIWAVVNDLPAGTYYWSTVARNDYTGTRSGSSTPVSWTGANIQPYNPISNTGGISGNQIQYNTIVNNNVANNTLTGNKIMNGAISGSKIANNTITFNNISSSLISKEALVSTGFQTTDIVGNIVNIPVNVTSRSGNYQTPFYITGNDPGNSYLYPSYQNTSTTANGYYADSTAQWTPALTNYTARQDGDWNWYYITFADLSGDVFYAGEYMFYEIVIQFVSNAYGKIQVYSGAELDGDGYINGREDYMTTIELFPNEPVVLSESRALYAEGANITGAAYLVRNITNSSNVTVDWCTFEVYRAKGYL